jgi:hypothetical protein
MKWWAIALSGLVLSCSTDTFIGDDSGVDGGGGPGDVRADGPPTADGPIANEGGGTDGGTNPCLNLGNLTGCGSGNSSNWCTSPNVCCASDNGAQCSSACSGASLACRDTDDCNVTTTPDAAVLVCCLVGSTIAPDSCPRGLSGGQSTCSASCPSPGIKLCKTSSECSGVKTCQKISAGKGAVQFGACL